MAKTTKTSVETGSVETAPKANGKAAARDRSAAKVPARERRTALIKLLRKLKATSFGAARPISELATKLGYNTYDVYCLAYHKYPLAVAGLVETVKTEESRELQVHLTAKGAKVNLEEIP